MRGWTRVFAMAETRGTETAHVHVLDIPSSPAHAGATPLGFLRSLAARKPLGFVGLLVIVLMGLVALLAPLLAPYDPIHIYFDKVFRPPGREFLLGTDNVGRDILSRIIWGARISLVVGLASAGIGAVLGASVGLVSAYVGGTLDILVQRVVDSLMVFPSLILGLAIVGILGPSLTNVVAAIAIVLLPQAARVIRSVALAAKGNPYIEAARAIGASNLRIMLAHLLPQCVAPFIVIATAEIGSAIVVEASLSFLGVGVPPPEPSWGGMLAGAARRYAETAPWMGVFPGIAISMTVFGFNYLGDALRDVLDPRMRGQ